MLTSFSKLQEDFHGIETEYVKILTYDLEEGLKDKYKSYAYNRICTIVEGTKEVTINRETNFTYNKDEFVLLAPHSSVDMHIIKPTKAVVFEISDKLIETIHQEIEEEVNADIETTSQLFVSNLTEDMKYPIRKMANTVAHDLSGKQFLLDLYAQELVYNLIHQKHVLSQEIVARKPVDVAAQILRQEGNEDISIQEVAKLVHMSNANLTYLFKRQFQMSPKQYQNMVRLKRSGDLLRNYNVTEVAMMLGFTNISYFIRMFKQVYAMTPKQYQKKMVV